MFIKRRYEYIGGGSRTVYLPLNDETIDSINSIVQMRAADSGQVPLITSEDVADYYREKDNDKLDLHFYYDAHKVTLSHLLIDSIDTIFEEKHGILIQEIDFWLDKLVGDYIIFPIRRKRK